jgi:hypothetical protein
MAPISIGELVDKITILTIKKEKLKDEDKLKNVDQELAQLTSILHALELPDITELQHKLRLVNKELWDIEDFKRSCEIKWKFGPEFILAARQVYLKNDIRARLKRDINVRCGSTIVEEKSYANI